MSGSVPSDITYFIETEEELLLHRLQPAKLLPGLREKGLEVEDATRNAAAVFGLPDFVFRSHVRTVGSGQREIGDAIVLGYDIAAVLQVKARTQPSGNESRERTWLEQRIAKAIRQANGTLRAFGGRNTQLTNERGREVEISVSEDSWLRVVVLDHPTPPDDYVLETQPGLVVLLRRDWEFLFEQLMSTTAVLRYLERVSTESPIHLGGEPTRYFQRALADLDASPEEIDPKYIEPGAKLVSWPLLPLRAPDERELHNHLFLRSIMEDIATSPLEGDVSESDRVHVLSALDSLPVPARSDLGRTIRSFISEMSQHNPKGVDWRHRKVISPTGPRLFFSVTNGASVQVREAYASYVRLRHLQHGEQSDTLERLSVGVLISRRLDGRRPWDTTLYAVRGDQYLDAEHRSQLEKLWPVTMAK